MSDSNINFFTGNLAFLKKTFSKPWQHRLIDSLHEQKLLSFVKNWDPVGKNDKKKTALFQKLFKFDREDSQGLIQYLLTSRKLLSTDFQHYQYLKNNKKVISPPPTKHLYNHKDQERYIKKASTLLNQIAIILVAGGLGQRLSSNEIKIKLKVDLFTNRSFMYHYATMLKQLENLSVANPTKRKNSIQQTSKIPLIIMTSDENHEKTLSYFKEEKFFSLSKDQVFFIKQRSGPGIANQQGELAVHGYNIDFLPLGHGCVHEALYQSSLIQKLLKKKVDYLFFFQDTHLQVKNLLLSSLGVLHSHKKKMAFITVKKKLNEKLGIVAQTKIIDNQGKGKASVENLEYNELEKYPKSHLVHKGLNANTNSFWLRLDDYQKVLKKNQGKISPFINPKLDGKGRFLKPTRLESLMQDISKELSFRQVIAINYERYLAFAPLKNSVEDVINAPNSSPMTAVEMEESRFKTNREKILFSSMTNRITQSRIKKKRILDHFTLSDDAKIISDHFSNITSCVFKAQSLFVCELSSKLKSMTLHPQAALIIQKASPQINATIAIDNLTFREKGYEIILLSKKEILSNRYSFAERTRGYRVNWLKPYRYLIEKNGDYLIDENFKLVKTN